MIEDLPADLWKNQTVYIVGGGPSLIGFDFERLRGHNVIALNSACLGCQNMGASLLFVDDMWAFARPDLIESWDGLIFTSARGAKIRWLMQVHFADLQHRQPHFIVGHWPKILYGRTSGHVGISLAIGLMANRVVLLGYDMRAIPHGPSHWHKDYSHITEHYRFTGDHLPGFKGWQAMAERVGVEVINATPDSALEEFPRRSIDDLL